MELINIKNAGKIKKIRIQRVQKRAFLVEYLGEKLVKWLEQLIGL